MKATKTELVSRKVNDKEKVCDSKYEELEQIVKEQYQMIRETCKYITENEYGTQKGSKEF